MITPFKYSRKLIILLCLLSVQFIWAQKNKDNNDPVAVDDAATVVQGETVIIPVLANDYDVDGDPLSIQRVRRARGVVHVIGDTVLSYEPTPNFLGEDSFEYRVTDSNRGRASATVVVTVLAAAANQDPIAVDDAATTDEDIPVTIDMLANDSDPDMDVLTVESVTQGSNGAVTLNPDGTATYTPDSNYNGSDSFGYTISDGKGGSASATVSVAIDPVNDPPVADDQSVFTNEDESVAITLTGSDMDGDQLIYSVISGPANGQLAGTAPDLTYTPDADYNGPDSFTFEASDNQASDEGTVSISVGAFNDPPVAVDDDAVTDEDTPVTVDVLANDSDPEGDALSVSGVTQGVNGAVTLNSDGTVTYTPSADFNGTDSFGYTVSDGNGGTDDGAVMITVNAVNDAPVAVDDAATTQEDTPITIDVLANDFDVDKDILSIQNVTQANGVVHINSDETLDYEPTPNFSGIDEFYYTVVDGNGGQATATVIVTVGSENDAPVAADDQAVTKEDTPVDIDVLANDIDYDGDPLTVTDVTQGANGAVTINTDGTVTYTPNANFNGSDSFGYTVSDGNGGSDDATVSITVTAVNDSPIADDQSLTTNEDVAVSITLTGSDPDGDLLSFSMADAPSNGTLSGTAPNLTYTPGDNYNGSDAFTFTVSDGIATSQPATVSITVSAVNDPPVADAQSVITNEDVAVSITLTGSDPDGDPLSFSVADAPSNGTLSGTAPNLTYAPSKNYNGSDAFTFTASDGIATSQPATVSITVDGVNDAPVAQDDAYSGSEDTPLTVNTPGVLANDDDIDGDALNATLVNGPANGSLNLNTDGSFTYTPAAGYNGTVTFTYRADDGTVYSNNATVSLNISAVNDPPVADAQSVTTAEDVAVAITLTGSDPDGDPLSFSVADAPANGTLSGTTPNLTYTPGENYNGSDAFTFTASDGIATSQPATVSITVNAVNDAPVAQDDAYSGSEDTPLTVDAPGVLANDTDVDGDPLTATLVDGPAEGSLTLNADGSFTYTPASGYNGTATFTYQASDGDLASNTATVSITVSAVNDPPVAVDDEAFTDQDTPVTIDVLLNDSDPDGDVLTVSEVDDPDHGTVQINPEGTLTYTPDAGFNGSDIFSYEVSDGHGGHANALVTVYVNISGITTGVTVGPDGGTVSSPDGATIDIPSGALSGDVDIQIGTYTTPPLGADVAGLVYFFGPTGTQFATPVTITVPYDPALIPEGYSESDLALLLYDESNGSWEILPSSVNTITHMVTGTTTHFSGFAPGILPNQAPQVLLNLPDEIIAEDTPYATIVQSLGDYFGDLDEGDVLTFSATALDDGLETVIVDQDQNLIVVCSADFFGDVRILVTATDNHGASVSDTLTLTITPVNDAPRFLAIIPDFSMPEDGDIRLPLSAMDVESDPLSFSATSDTSGVTVTVADTLLQIEPAANWYGSAQVIVSVSDGQLAKQDTFTVTVESVNDAPSDFGLFEPAHETTLQMQAGTEDSLTFSWDASNDPDGDAVTYTFQLSDSAGITWEYEGLTTNEVRVAHEDIVAAIRDQGITVATFWWTILAVSGQDAVEAIDGPYLLIIDVGTLAVGEMDYFPQFFVLHQNYPNPFNPLTTIKYELPVHTQVLLVIYDLRGREVIRLVDGYVGAGYNKVVWNSSDATGRPVPSGVYIARLITPEYTQTMKMSLVR
ncbi:MAG: tandem-95 repeat protein [Fidelibacterota bacterium]|nr:MAG: tandem-95 repeat protein [Candidatus Neomarinimicrobiota bacterium]